MVIAVDIGNTYCHLGRFRGDCLTGTTAFPTSRGVDRRALARFLGDRPVGRVAIASVVPQLTRGFTKYLLDHCGVKPLVVSHRLRTGLRLCYRPRSTLGPDRIANAVAARALVRGDLLVLSFGTAVTIDLVRSDGTFLGGMILPGHDAIVGALADRAALLPRVRMSRPIAAIGTTTRGCLQAGSYYVTKLGIEGIIRLLRASVRGPLVAIATGGWGGWACRNIVGVDRYVRHLTLRGIMLIQRHNG